MPIYKIRGIDVDFPYEAYDCQIVYMDKVIQSLQDKSNALLESPTGTGKTLCLLCATLAWRRNLGEFSTGGKVRLGSTQSQPDSLSQSQQAAETKLPTIVYTTRTHSQLHQVIQELKRTNYRPKMVVIGSREQLCINNEVQMLHGRAQTNACQFLRRKRKCSHYARISDFVKDNSGLGDDPIDIEDLVNIGRLQGPCPYYLSRELHKVVDILFAPYNYLIDRGNRKSLSIKWQDSVLIFDEAHNLESICADAASFDLPSSLLTACILEAKKCVNLAVEKRAVEKFNDKSVSPDAFAILEALLQKLEKRIAEVPIESRELGFTRPGPYIYELLADLNITQDTTNMLIDTITNGVTLLEDAENASSSGTNKTKGTIHRLEALADMLRIIFNEGDKSHAKSYRVHVQEAETRALDALKGRTSRTLSWWCFNPGIAMEEFSKLCVGSIILTSGTLSPLDSFAHELKLNFPVRLENPHVISSNQIWAGVVPTGPSGCSFNSSYRNRDSLTYKQDLGNAIANFARIVPDGLLVFFPSYYLLDQCIGCWKDMSHSSSENSTTIWERICKHKQPVVEPKQSSLFSSSIDDFMAKLNDISTSGAVFFAVCRGKVSEGLDFADHTGRAVVITGMPFATWNDPKVRLKRDYLDHQTAPENKSFKALTGDEWYSQQASRAVNQAVGRVIRHRDDYGAILFCDERFSSSNNQRQMSRWLQPHIKCFSNFGEVNFTLTRFFREKVTSGLGKSTKPVKSGSKSSTKVSPPPHKLLSAETIAVSGTADKEIPKRSFSSVSAAYKSDVCTNLEEIVPANRSSLTPYKKDYFTALKQSRDVFGTANRLSTPASKRKVLKDQKSPVIDLTGTSERDEQREKAQSNVLCCSKESKLLKLDPEIAVHSKKQPHLEKIHDVKNEHLASYSSSSISQQHGNHLQLSQCSSAKAGIGRSYGNKKNPEVGPVVIFENNVTSKDNVLELPSQKDIPSGTVPCNDESSGYIFLTQVKEMLTVEEYKEFVGYMKAMKTKKMKINQVFQSVATLFSSPERYVLLVSFKDYLPTKYKPVFEQYLRTHDAAADG